MSTNMKAFKFKVDDNEYSATLDSEARTPFKVMPGDNPTMEVALEVYSESMDTIYNGQTFYLVIGPEDETIKADNEELPMNG